MSFKHEIGFDVGDLDVIISLGDCECSKCHHFLPDGSGIMLRACLHPFCRKCLVDTIMRNSTQSKIMCPFTEDNSEEGVGAGAGAGAIFVECESNGYLTLREIEAVLSVEEHKIYVKKSGHRHSAPDMRTKIKSESSREKQSNLVPVRNSIGKLDMEVLNNSGYHIVLTERRSNCAYCADDLKPGDGVILQICSQIFCRPCLEDAIRGTSTVKINCPVASCEGFLLDREIKQIASQDLFEQYLRKCLKKAEEDLPNIFHCKTKSCTGMCQIAEDTNRVFLCPICQFRNCLTCKAIHEEVSCEKFNEILAKGYSKTQASEIVKNERRSGWDQLYSYVNNGAELRGHAGANSMQNRTYNSICEKIERSLVLPSTKVFSCSICFEDIPPGRGIILQDCLHLFCRECIVNHISHVEDAEIKCPFVDADYSCSALIAPREIKAILPKNKYDEYLGRSIKLAELTTKNAFHCLTPDCPGWCEAEESAKFFWCPVCGRENCMKCKDFHENTTCEQYKQKIEDDKNRKVQLQNEKKGEAAVLASIASMEFQRCPRCSAVCHKIDGCLHVVCAACKTSFNWIAR